MKNKTTLYLKRSFQCISPKLKQYQKNTQIGNKLFQLAQKLMYVYCKLVWIYLNNNMKFFCQLTPQLASEVGNVQLHQKDYKVKEESQQLLKVQSLTYQKIQKMKNSNKFQLSQNKPKGKQLSVTFDKYENLNQFNYNNSNFQIILICIHSRNITLNFIIEINIQQTMKESGKKIMKIYDYQSKFLRTKCQQMTFPLSTTAQQNIIHLKECFRQTLKDRITLGLAAPQVGILYRFFLIPKSLNYTGLPKIVIPRVVRNFEVYINPTIINMSDSKQWIQETCLSVQDQTYNIQRSSEIDIEYYNKEGQKISQRLSGLRARVFLHENDHLDGITIKDCEGGLKVPKQPQQSE